jgi:hypothetical protein
MTEHALADLLAADLSDLDLVAIMIDGVHFADHLGVVALGIDIDGVKHPLALVEGSTENTTLVPDGPGTSADRGRLGWGVDASLADDGQVQRSRQPRHQFEVRPVALARVPCSRPTLVPSRSARSLLRPRPPPDE